MRTFFGRLPQFTSASAGAAAPPSSSSRRAASDRADGPPWGPCTCPSPCGQPRRTVASAATHIASRLCSCRLLVKSPGRRVIAQASAMFKSEVKQTIWLAAPGMARVRPTLQHPRFQTLETMQPRRTVYCARGP